MRNVSFSIAPGDSFALVGESGSGKSTIAYAILRVLPPAGFLAGGRIFLTGRDLTALPEKEMRKLRGSHITLVPQDPITSLNPSQRIGGQVAEVFRLHQAMSRDEALEKAVDMLARVKLPEPAVTARKYPHEISGGQRQRVLIAIAFSTNPDLLILDEPTTGLDVTTEAKILDLIREMQESYKTAILFISHNLGVVKALCRQIAVIYAGEIVEQGLVTEVFGKCAHPYTKGLLECIPHHTSSARKTALHVIEGSLPDMTR
ncbi:MAG: ATP-binding cassette domain-containing protein, partial [Deltaproteobacteria bacterium]|nr:ATP-binding cassette domain-containing protein [Deltaproteobacteria bacterium]